MSRAKGNKGEALFKQLMDNGNNIIVDVSDNPDYFDKDIDFIITNKLSGNTRTFEVKADYNINRTGNLYLEYSNVNSTQWNGEGWYLHCKADYVAYGDAIGKCFYIVPFDQLKERADQVKVRWAKCGNDSEGQLISLDEIRDIIVGELRY